MVASAHGCTVAVAVAVAVVVAVAAWERRTCACAATCITRDASPLVVLWALAADEPRLGVVECQNRFVWNVYLLQHMLRQVGGGASPTPTHTHWVLPIIHGFFKQKSLHLQRSARVDITLVSRRSRHFAGTRYLRRGVNADGDVANEVETEQVVWRADAGEHGRGRVASVVQLRGSVPIMWSHANLSHPKPDIVVKPPTEGVPLSRRHFEQLAARYKLPVICLSLVKVGTGGYLAAAVAAAVAVAV